jgi:predicted nucleic acid-binding protein
MIVSDATILITLINIDAWSVLKLFVDTVIIPPEVYKEVSQHTNAKSYLDREIAEGYISVQEYRSGSIFRHLHYILDAGESASMTLAIERGLPLIIDEKKGRKIARSQGIEIVGLVGILRFLYVEKRLSREELMGIIEKLNRSDFRISSALLALVLA